MQNCRVPMGIDFDSAHCSHLTNLVFETFMPICFHRMHREHNVQINFVNLMFWLNTNLNYLFTIYEFMQESFARSFEFELLMMAFLLRLSLMPHADLG